MADFNIGGSWDFDQLSSSGLANSITAQSVYYDSGTGLLTYGAAAGGVAFDPSFSYTITAALWTINGAFQFNSGFDINAPNEISIISTGSGNPVTIQATNDNLNLNADGNALLQSFSNNVFIQALAGGQQVQIYADGFNFSCQNGDANFNSVNANVNINATNASLNLGGGNIDINATNNLNMFTTGAGNANFNTANGSLSIYSTSGDLNVNAGNASTSGNLNMGSSSGGGNINVNNDLNFNSTVGQVSMNAAVANISVGPSGIGMGSGGSGMSVDSTTGNFSFGAGSGGSFLIGSILSSVTMLAHTSFNIVVDLNDYTVTATAGNVILTGGASIKFILPTPALSINTPLLINPDGTIHV